MEIKLLCFKGRGILQLLLNQVAFITYKSYMEVSFCSVIIRNNFDIEKVHIEISDLHGQNILHQMTLKDIRSQACLEATSSDDRIIYTNPKQYSLKWMDYTLLTIVWENVLWSLISNKQRSLKGPSSSQVKIDIWQIQPP